MAKSSSSPKAQRFAVVKHTPHFDIVKGHHHRFAVRHGAHKVVLHNGERFRVVGRTHRYVFLRAFSKSVTAKPTIVAPNGGALAWGASTAVSWTMSAAVSTGYCRVSLKNAVGGASTELSKTSARRGVTNYSVPWSVTQPTGTYSLRVIYYSSQGRVVGSDVSDGSLAITSSLPPTPTPTPTATPTAAPSPTPSATPTVTPTPTPSPAVTLNVMHYGAKADGTTDDRAAIAACAQAAVAVGKRVYFPPGTYRLAGTMGAVEGAYYYAPSGVVLRAQGAVNGASNVTFDGFAFQSYGSTLGIRIGTEGSTTAVSNMTVKDCSFVAGTQEYSWSRILAYRANDCVIDHNTFTGSAGSGGNIQIIGGKRNHITNNTITGGTTAILFMWGRSSNGGGLDSIIEDNVVTGNVYSGCSEEGISFDLQANSAEDCGAFEYDSIAAVSGQTVTLSDLAFPSYVGYDIIFLDGHLAGRTRTITAQSNPTFAVSGDLTGAAPGDKVVIGAAFKHNYIANNTGTCRDLTDPAILLYGLCFGNVVEHNTVVQGTIKVQSLDTTPVATGSATGTNGRAPCGYNTVQYNTVQSSSARIDLEYWALGGSYTPFISVGNNVVGNTTPQMQATHQHAYISGNTGSTSSSDVIQAASSFAYDGQ